MLGGILREPSIPTAPDRANESESSSPDPTRREPSVARRPVLAASGSHSSGIRRHHRRPRPRLRPVASALRRAAGQQPRPGMGHDTNPSAGHLDPRARTSSVHIESVFVHGDHGPTASPETHTGEALPSSTRPQADVILKSQGSVVATRWSNHPASDKPVRHVYNQRSKWTSTSETFDWPDERTTEPFPMRADACKCLFEAELPQAAPLCSVAERCDAPAARCCSRQEGADPRAEPCPACHQPLHPRALWLMSRTTSTGPTSSMNQMGYSQPGRRLHCWWQATSAAALSLVMGSTSRSGGPACASSQTVDRRSPRTLEAQCSGLLSTPAFVAGPGQYGSDRI
jgi:hypothetical protein